MSETIIIQISDTASEVTPAIINDLIRSSLGTGAKNIQAMANAGHTAHASSMYDWKAKPIQTPAQIKDFRFPEVNAALALSAAIAIANTKNICG